MVQLKVELGATSVVALLDTGSTHNFISEAAALSLGLPIQSRPWLTVMVANGEKVSRPGVLRQVPVTIDGREFCVDLFVMPLNGFDVVLGTVWMATLRPIIWDFTAQTMMF
jgi:predicted aspartyl protease